ncbi:C-C chemokine receptor type 8-like [Carassius auratus]|uniref:C-C chemokine receptor type 8-like n=1 Tax=Carassius auratus TaxID=7957 RepID=A0A6P6M146_CARAU|nr:C-C chemokine receptor type 8-like [Carassius auratus]
MNNSTVNFTSPETFTYSTTQPSGNMDKMNIPLYSIFLLFGLPINSYVLRLIITGKGSKVAQEFFNLNLAICEISYCVNYLLSILASFIWFSHLKTLTSFLVGLAITGRPLFQCLMCVERYLAVVHPVTFLKYKPLRYRVICCTAAWIITLVSCTCCIFTIIPYYIVYLWFFSLQFLLFLSIQLFCLVAVLRALKQSGPGERGRERGEENHMKRRAFHLILITTASMIIIYAPFSISAFVVIVSQHYIKELFYFSFICFSLASFVQPVLYLQRVGKLSCLCSL